MAKGGAGNFWDNSPAKRKQLRPDGGSMCQLKGHKSTMSVAKVASSTFEAHFDKTDSAGKFKAFS